MTLKEKIGQCLMVGFEGTHPPREILRLVEEYGLGGVILFKRNITDPFQLAQLITTLQKKSTRAPLFIALDCEGGRVSRLPPPFTHFPPLSFIGTLNSVPLSYRVGEIMATELRAAGINMNLAPVLDVNTNPANPVIGDRSLGRDPLLVSRLGLAIIAGLQDNGVIACGKHFPGHGDTSTDSHRELPVSPHSLKRLQEVELRPFYHATQNGLASIMTAHVLYPKLDAKQPATLSPKIVNGLLRQRLGFAGVVLTDDLAMEAITSHHTIQEAGLLALHAGCDILLCSPPDAHREMCETLLTAVQKGTLSEERITQSLSRILSLKERFLLPYKPATPQTIKEIIGQKSHQEVARQITEQGKMLPPECPDDSL